MNKEISQWLNAQSPEMKEICELLRSKTLKLMPTITEFIYHNSIGFSLSKSPFDRVTYIAVQNDSYVNYGFFYGKDLNDRENLIQGEGKRMRHVKIYSLQEAKSAGLTDLIKQAWNNAEGDVTIWRNSLKRKKS